MSPKRILLGEIISTFLLIFMGCGSVIAAVVLGALPNLASVAAVWGMAVTFGIVVARPISGAHMNPAVSFAFTLSGHTKWKELPWYVISQFIGAFLAAAALYAIFGSAIEAFELREGILRGSPGSTASAMVFGEYYPNPGFSDILTVDTPLALVTEAIGTFFLMLVIYQLAFRPSQSPFAFALAIGLLIFGLICIIAPLTQCGLNPARDMGPRLFSALAGWGSATLPHGFGEIAVYVLGPVLGASAAALLQMYVIKPVDSGEE